MGPATQSTIHSLVCDPRHWAGCAHGQSVRARGAEPVRVDPPPPPSRWWSLAHSPPCCPPPHPGRARLTSGSRREPRRRAVLRFRSICSRTPSRSRSTRSSRQGSRASMPAAGGAPPPSTGVTRRPSPSCAVRGTSTARWPRRTISWLGSQRRARPSVRLTPTAAARPRRRLHPPAWSRSASKNLSTSRPKT